MKVFTSRNINKTYVLFSVVSFLFLLLLPLNLIFKTLVKAEPVSATISGSIFTDVSATQTLEATVDVSLAVNGVYLDIVSTTETFIFSNVSVEEGDVLTIYLDGNDSKSVTLTKVSSEVDNTTIVSNLYLDHLTLNSTGPNVITRNDVNLANNVDDEDINEFYEDGLDLNTLNGHSVLITENTTFDAIASMDLSGGLFLANNATVNSGAILISGDLDNYGTISTGIINFREELNQNIFSSGVLNIEYLTLQKTAGTVYLQSNMTIFPASIFIYLESTLDLNGHYLFTQDVNVDSGSLIMNSDGNLDLDGGQGSISLSNGAYFEGNGNDLNMINLSITSGSIFVSSSQILYTENLTVTNSTFDHNGGTVTFTGSINSIDGNNFSTIVFNNFYIADPEENEEAMELVVKERVTLRVLGALTVAGNGSDLLYVHSNGEFPFYIEMSGESSAIYPSNLNISNTTISAVNDSTVTIPINPPDSVDGGTTMGWFPLERVIYGVAWLPDGSDSLEEGHEIVVAINGSEVTTVTTDSTGEFYAEDLFFEQGDVIFLYLTGNLGASATTVLKVGNEDEFTYVDIYQDYLTLDGRNEEPLNKQDLLNGHTGVGSVSFSQSELDVNNLLYVPINLYITHGSYVDIDSEANIEYGLGIDGSVNFQDRDITIHGDLYIYGTLESAAEIIIKGEGDYVIGTGLEVSIPTDLEINGAASVTFITSLDIGGTLEIKENSILDCGIDNSLQVLSNVSIIDSSYNCDGEGDFLTYGDLILNNSSYTASEGSLTVNNLELTNNSTLTSGSEIHILENFNLDSDSTFIPNGGTVFLGGYENRLIGNITFHNLIKIVEDDNFSSSIIFSSGSIFSVTGQLALSGLDSDNLLLLSPSAEGQFFIELLGESAYIGGLYYLEIENSEIYGTDSTATFPVRPNSSVDLGNTVGWFSTDVITEQIILNSPESNSIHNTYVPISIQVPEAIGYHTLMLIFMNSDRTVELTLYPIDPGEPFNFNLNINNIFEDYNVWSIFGIDEYMIPDGTYTLIASYQDALFNPASTVSKTNVKIDRSYVEPDSNPDESEENENTENNTNHNVNNTVVQTSANLIPVSSPVINNEDIETDIDKNEILQTAANNTSNEAEEIDTGYSFPWWIIIIIVSGSTVAYLIRRRKDIN